MSLTTDPVPKPFVLPADDPAVLRGAALLARHGVLEREMADAPFYRVNTFWWEERAKEMASIRRRLGK